jgi:predicted component of type VI protein secretion system
MRYAEELLRLIQEGDQVLQSFLDFFNHRIIQNLYRIRKSCYLQFYASDLFQALCSLFAEKKRFKSHEGFAILASKISSTFVLRQIIAQIVGPETKITIHKGVGKWVKFEKNSFPCRLGKILLGEKIWVNEILVVNLKCSSRAQYEMIITNSIVKDVVAEYSNSYEVRVFLEKVKYRQIFLGSSRLLLGICL